MTVHFYWPGGAVDALAHEAGGTSDFTGTGQSAGHDPGLAGRRDKGRLAAAGQDIGAHDRLFAATAITAGWRVVTANLRHFDRIAGLDTLTVTFTGGQPSCGVGRISIASDQPGSMPVTTGPHQAGRTIGPPPRTPTLRNDRERRVTPTACGQRA